MFGALTIAWAVLKRLGLAIFGWLFGDWRRALAAAVLILLMWTHWEAYTSGKESIETKFAKQQAAALAKATADAEKIKELQKKLADKQAIRDDSSTAATDKKVEEITESVKANPSPSNCVSPTDELKLLNELIHKANEAGTH